MRASGFEQIIINGSSASGGTNASSLVADPVTLYVHRARDITMRVRQKFAFNSTDKRMSVIAECLPSMQASSGPSSSREVQQQPNLWVFTKGAPEVLEGLLSEVPAFYRSTYVYHMSRGKRVLALAARKVVTVSSPATGPTSSSAKNSSSSSSSSSSRVVSSSSVSAASSAVKGLRGWQPLSRNEAERSLQFVGFVIFDCDMKPVLFTHLLPHNATYNMFLDMHTL